MKTVFWIASSKKDLEDLPKNVIQEFGYALYQAQQGSYPDIAKTLKGFGSAEVIELIENDSSGTFRAIYTVRFTDAIIVLHIFQKKSTKGIETPKQDIDLIHARLKQAELIYKDWKSKRK